MGARITFGCEPKEKSAVAEESRALTDSHAGSRTSVLTPETTGNVTETEEC